ncbi:MAG: hypothetical protein EXS17_02140 [Phycisphaerales bacterium]|nr:hypothetical protein [Phycisphaerales bacterium]
MNVPSILTVASSIALFSSLPSFGQDPPAAPANASAQDATGSDPQINMALGHLTVELNALHSMIDSLGDVRTNSEDRINAMDAFIKEKVLTDGWKTYAASTKSLPPGTSFLAAYQTTLHQEQLKGTPNAAMQDLDLLTREVSAATIQAQAGWNSQNQRFAQVALRSAFLQSKNLLDDYQQWAPTYAAAQRKAQTARYAAMNANLNAQASAYYKHLEELHEQWDKMPHNTGLNFNEICSQGDGDKGAFSQTAQSANAAVGGGGVSVNSPEAVGVNTPWQYAGAGGGYYPGAYSGSGGYYGGSNWNSYSDGYYDLNGYPADTGFGGDNFTPVGVHKIWNRSSDAALVRGPNAGPVGGGVRSGYSSGGASSGDGGRGK